MRGFVQGLAQEIDDVRFQRFGHHYVEDRLQVPICVVKFPVEHGPGGNLEGLGRAFTEMPHNVGLDFEVVLLVPFCNIAYCHGVAERVEPLICLAADSQQPVAAKVQL